MDTTHFDFDALRDEAKSDGITNVKAALKKHLLALDAMIDKADDPEVLIEHIEWLTDCTKAGRDNVREHKPVALLGAGPVATTGAPATDDAIAKLKQLAVLTHVSLDDFAVMAQRLFQPLTSVSGDQLRARAACMQMVAEGTLRVKEDGSPELLDKVARLESDLAAFKPAIDALRGVDRTEQVKRLKGINKVADGTTSVKADGSVETTVTGVPQGDHDAVKADLDAANAALDDVKSHISDGRLSGTPKLNFGALKRETKDRLNG